MDWTTVGKAVIPLAPVLGSILGGFIPVPGGSMIGQLAGQAAASMIAKKLGVPATPDAVAGALASNDKDVLIAKLNAAADELRSTNEAYAKMEVAYAEAQTKQLAEINATMRAEILPENRHPYFTGWRPACGWVMVYSFLVYGNLLFVAIALAAFWKAVEPLKVIVEAWPAAASYFGALALVNGVNIWTRSKDKETARSVPPVPGKKV